MNSNDSQKYRMTISLSVLDELGINQYSNVPAVLAEAVANAWDADANHVNIDIDRKEIVIKDDGHGMTEEDINNKYLTIGYHRRESNEAQTPNGRPVMGRKGIGKLSLFSIADCIQVHTMKDREQNGFEMKVSDIRKTRQKNNNEKYYPRPINFIGNTKGTKIVLTELKKRITTTTVDSLKKRLSRRFSIIGPSHNFEVKLNEDSISPEDRDYYHKVQYIWYYGKDGKKYKELCHKQKKADKRENTVSVHETTHKVFGWIGTVQSSGDVKSTGTDSEDLNRIVVMVRGKLAHENVLPLVTEGRIFTKYIMGEIHADFLDQDTKEDIATSNRQNIKEDDPRFQYLVGFIRTELNHIANEWTKLRNEEGEGKARKNPAIDKWYKTLKGDTEKTARKVFGSINSAPIDDEKRNEMFKIGVLAIERLKISNNLSALDNINIENLGVFSDFFANNDEIEASLYHEITSGRLKVINQLVQKVDEGAREKIIQKHIFDHLWLLDPSWDRATANPRIEQKVTTEFKNVDNQLTQEEKNGRIDIRYRSTAGKHIIVELKKPSVRTDTEALSKQLKKYKSALQKVVKDTQENWPIECICIIGEDLSDWSYHGGKSMSADQLKALSARVVMYDMLIVQAQSQYEQYLSKQKEANRIIQLIEQIGKEYQKLL